MEGYHVSRTYKAQSTTYIICIVYQINVLMVWWFHAIPHGPQLLQQKPIIWGDLTGSQKLWKLHCFLLVLPSSGLTNPTFGKGKSPSIYIYMYIMIAFSVDMLVPRRAIWCLDIWHYHRLNESWFAIACQDVGIPNAWLEMNYSHIPKNPSRCKQKQHLAEFTLPVNMKLPYSKSQKNESS